MPSGPGPRFQRLGCRQGAGKPPREPLPEPSGAAPAPSRPGLRCGAGPTVAPPLAAGAPRSPRHPAAPGSAGQDPTAHGSPHPNKAEHKLLRDAGGSPAAPDGSTPRWGPRKAASRLQPPRDARRGSGPEGHPLPPHHLHSSRRNFAGTAAAPSPFPRRLGSHLVGLRRRRVPPAGVRRLLLHGCHRRRLGSARLGCSRRLSLPLRPRAALPGRQPHVTSLPWKWRGGGWRRRRRGKRRKEEKEEGGRGAASTAAPPLLRGRPAPPCPAPGAARASPPAAERPAPPAPLRSARRGPARLVPPPSSQQVSQRCPLAWERPFRQHGTGAVGLYRPRPRSPRPRCPGRRRTVHTDRGPGGCALVP